MRCGVWLRCGVVQYPAAVQRFMSAVSRILAELLVAQFEAGAQYLQVFESHSGELPPYEFTDVLLPHLKYIVDTVKATIAARFPTQAVPPVVIFARGSHYAIGDLVDTNYDVIGLDWSVDPAAARYARHHCLLALLLCRNLMNSG